MKTTISRKQQQFFLSSSDVLSSHFIDPDSDQLEIVSSLRFPGSIQYAWQHPAIPILYVATGDRFAENARYDLAVVSLDAETGHLLKTLQTVNLASRPIHTSVDGAGRFLLVAFGGPGCPNGVSIYPIKVDGMLGDKVPQIEQLDVGNFPHQALFSPANDLVFVCARGTDAGRDRPEDVGAIKVFGFSEGKLSNLQTIAPDCGKDFRPRHLVFHPNGKWVYVSVESQNEVHMYELQAGRLRDRPSFVQTTLSNPFCVMRPQLAGAIHLHPRLPRLYVANRGSATDHHNSIDVFRGGENSIAVFGIDPATGRPNLLQHAATDGYHTRTFSIDQSAQILVATGVKRMTIKVGEEIRVVQPRLSVFRINDCGDLQLVRVLDLDHSAGEPFWSGFCRPYRP